MGQSCSRNAVVTEKLHLLLSLCLSKDGTGHWSITHAAKLGTVELFKAVALLGAASSCQGQERHEISLNFNCFQLLCWY